MVTITHERALDAPAREVLLDRAFGKSRRRKTSEKLRRGRLPAEGLAFTARSEDGAAIIAEVLAGIADHGRVQSERDRRRAIAVAVAMAGRDDTVLIAGKGHEPYQEIHGTKHDFDDLVEADLAMKTAFAAGAAA